MTTPRNRADAARHLGVDRDADAGQIQHAFRRAARRAHPDTGDEAGSLSLIVEARRTLLAPSAPPAFVASRTLRIRRWQRTVRRAIDKVPLARRALPPSTSRVR